MKGKALLLNQELLFLTIAFLFLTLRAVTSECTTNTIFGFSIQEFNFSTRSAVTSPKDCLESEKKAYQFTLDTPRAIKRLNVANITILFTQIIYSYNTSQWFNYQGNVTLLPSGTTEFQPPIFLNRLAVSLGPFSGGNQCLNVTLNACIEDIAPVVSFQQTNNTVLLDSIKVVCNIEGQPRWEVTWQTTDGFVFPTKYIENSYSTSSGPQNSTLTITKHDLSKEGFRCRPDSPPCTTIVCMAKYPGSTRSSNTSKNLDVSPASPEEFSITSALANSAIITWKKPVEDYIMNYTMFEIELISKQGSRRDTVPASNPEGNTFHHVLRNLSSCTFYGVELSAVNYREGSARVKRNFLTTAGLIAIDLVVQNITANSIVALWTTVEQFGDNCTSYNASVFLISYRCVQGLSYLNSCRQWQQFNVSSDMRQKDVTALNPATNYQIFVTALTDKTGFNVTSNVIDFTSYDAPPGTGPAYLRVSEIGISAVNVSWGVIMIEQQHGKILNYRLHIFKKNALFLVQNIPANAFKASVVTGLEGCTEYIFSLSGCNSAGCSPEVNRTARTLAGIFEAPLSVKVTLEESDPYNMSALVVAAGNISKEECITGIVIQYKEMAEENWKQMNESNFSRTTAVYGLKSSTVYIFRARFVGHSSVGNWTNEIIIKTNEGRPGIVQNLHYIDVGFNAINVKWESPPQPSGAISSYVVEAHGIRGYNTSFYELIKMNISNTTLGQLRNLSPATFYNISVHARNTKYNGPKSYVAYETDALPPLQPQPVRINEATSILQSILVTAEAVSAVNGPITGYQIIVEQRESNRQSINFSTVMPTYQEAQSRNLSFYLAKIVKPFNGIKKFFIGDGNTQSGLKNAPLNQRLNYTIYIRSYTDWKGKTLLSPTSSANLNRYPVENKPVIAMDKHTSSSSITIKLIPMGAKVQYTRIIIRKVGRNGATNLPHPDRYPDSNLTVYAVSKQNDLALPYITAELSKVYFGTFEQFVIGDGKQTNRSLTRKKRSTPKISGTTFFNGPLDPGSSYVLFFRAYHSDTIYFSSDWSSAISTEYLPTKQETPKSTSAGLIIGIVLCTLAVPFFICLGFILWKRNRKAFEANYRFSTMELVKNGRNSRTTTFSEDVFDPEGSCTSADNIPFFELTYEIDDDHAPIPVTNFPEHYEAMKGKDYAFDDEFNEVSNRSSKDNREGRAKTNIPLNRDPEAIPFDDFRVCIVRPWRQASDYINAAFIDSYNVQNAFIAAQAPMKETIEDFWTIVLQENIRTIVMLAHINDDKIDSPDYWPTSIKFVFGNGHIVVENRDNVFDDCATVRSFIVSGKKKAPRIVRHFQFNKWPPRGIPGSIHNLLSFRDLVNQWHKGKYSPKLIHCSNGSGCTGTYIAIDTILNDIALSKTVDIFNYVSYLRTRKIKMVETDRQYEFIYEVVNEVLNRVDQDTQITNRNARELYKSLNTVDSLTGRTGIQKLFKNLNRGLETEPSMARKQEGSKAENEYKNRYSFKVPRDNLRVRLPVSGSAQLNYSEYINATLVSLNASSNFITTQAPLGITINDFWAMVSFSKTEVIVSLNGLEEGPVSFTQYWPGSEAPSATYGNFKVSLELETNPFPCVIQRDFTLSEIGNSNKTTEVTQFHVLGWEDHDIPSSRTSILRLCNHLIKDWMSEETSPLVIQCSDGFGRSGTLCVCLEAIKQLSDNGTTDIPNIVRTFKEKNKFFVENEAQLKFIFDVALDFACRR